MCWSAVGWGVSRFWEGLGGWELGAEDGDEVGKSLGGCQFEADVELANMSKVFRFNPVRL